MFCKGVSDSNQRAIGGTGERFSGTTIKDTWTKPRGGGSKGGRWDWLGLVGVVGSKCRQL